jgi:hypothetical protein
MVVQENYSLVTCVGFKMEKDNYLLLLLLLLTTTTTYTYMRIVSRQ